MVVDGFDVYPEHRGHDGIGTGAITDVPRGNVWRLVTAAEAPTARATGEARP
ncbi:hypothetical protein ACIGO9_31650 [Nocardia asteroides]|uniref:hypothetical protein n=1 Tax=Nocardia asteroides TaxID=1824 RepID=UPI0037C676A5